MFSVLIGVVPPDLNENPQLDGVRWTDFRSLVQDDDGTDTLLIQAVGQPPDTPEGVVEKVQASSMGRDIQCEMWASSPAPLPLKPVGGYPFQDKNGVFREWGIRLQQQILDASGVQEMRLLVDEAIATAETSLAKHRPDISVGKDVFCFREMASRSQERFDLRLDVDSEIGRIVTSKIMNQDKVDSLLRSCLGPLDEVDFDISVVYSRPGACHQGWHSDGDHLDKDAGWDNDGWRTDMADAYAICLFLPLIDLDDDVGFTQFWPGSHRSRDLIGFGKVAEITKATFDGKCAAGDGVWYDYRLIHRGMPNRSASVRPVIQVIFKRKWYVERANYGKEPIAQEGGDT